MLSFPIGKAFHKSILSVHVPWICFEEGTLSDCYKAKNVICLNTSCYLCQDSLGLLDSIKQGAMQMAEITTHQLLIIAPARSQNLFKVTSRIRLID